MTAAQTHTVVREVSRDGVGVDGEVTHRPGHRLPYAAFVAGDWVGDAASADEAEALVVARLEDMDTSWEPQTDRVVS